MSGLIAYLTAVFSVLGSLGSAIFYVLRRLVRAEIKIDALWDFQVRRAMSEGLTRGLFTRNSPIHVPDEVRGWYTPILAEMRAYYTRSGIRLTQRELFIEFERRWGDWIVEHICIPHGLYGGACLIAAMSLAAEDPAADADPPAS